VDAADVKQQQGDEANADTALQHLQQVINTQADAKQAAAEETAASIGEPQAPPAGGSSSNSRLCFKSTGTRLR
jgi:hypothetical protein